MLGATQVAAAGWLGCAATAGGRPQRSAVNVVASAQNTAGQCQCPRASVWLEKPPPSETHQTR